MLRGDFSFETLETNEKIIPKGAQSRVSISIVPVSPYPPLSLIGFNLVTRLRKYRNGTAAIINDVIASAGFSVVLFSIFIFLFG